MRRLRIVLLLAAATPEAYARDPLQPGSVVQTHAGIGAVVGGDPTSLLTNPANLTTAVPGGESYGEVSPALIKHTYKHPDYSAYTLNVFAPLTSLGAAYRRGAGTVGLLLTPLGAGTKMSIAGMPVDLTPTTSASATASLTTTGYDAGLGGSWRFWSERLAVGAALIKSYKHNAMHIEIEGADAALLDADMEGDFYRVTLGGRLQLARWRYGLAVALPSTRRYRGTATQPGLGVNDPFPVETAEYQPLVIAVGAHRRLARWSVNAEYAYEAHAAGREVARSGFGTKDSRESNLRNAHDLSLSGDLPLGGRRSACAGVGYFQGDIGAGEYPGSIGKDNLGVAGMRFGSFSGMDRLATGAAYRLAEGAWSLSAGGYASYATTEVPRGHPQQGSYSLVMLASTLAMRWSF